MGNPMMQAGTYYVGDLCYVLHEAWEEFCELTIDGLQCLDGEFQLKDGRRFAVYSTYYGDGVFRLQPRGQTLLVDAGLIGCILYDDINFDDESQGENTIHGGVIVEFNHSFNTWSEDGVIHFGKYIVNTNDDDLDDDDSYEDELEDEWK